MAAIAGYDAGPYFAWALGVGKDMWTMWICPTKILGDFSSGIKWGKTCLSLKLATQHIFGHIQWGYPGDVTKHIETPLGLPRDHVFPQEMLLPWENIGKNQRESV